ncbi:MAG: ribonuclease III [Candidatus Brocadiales bacterium]
MKTQGASRTDSLEQCQKDLKYSFKDTFLLKRALIHTSCKLEYNGSNERLEFLGDAVLGMIISGHLYDTFPELSEGELTRIKSVVVSQPILAKAGNKLRLGQYITVGKGLHNKNTFPKSIIADVFEAIIAAIYIDGGINTARDFVLTHLLEEIQLASKDEHESNYKSLLQQHCQRRLNTTPQYKLIRQHGPDHGKTFVVVVVINDTSYGQGKGKSKKEAEQLAAKETLNAIASNKGRTGTKC